MMMEKVSSPVFDVGFSASEPRGINGKSNSFETSFFSSFHKLPNHVSVLIDLNQYSQTQAKTDT